MVTHQPPHNPHPKIWDHDPHSIRIDAYAFFHCVNVLTLLFTMFIADITKIFWGKTRWECQKCIFNDTLTSIRRKVFHPAELNLVICYCPESYNVLQTQFFTKLNIIQFIKVMSFIITSLTSEPKNMPSSILVSLMQENLSFMHQNLFPTFFNDFTKFFTSPSLM